MGGSRRPGPLPDEWLTPDIFVVTMLTRLRVCVLVFGRACMRLNVCVYVCLERKGHTLLAPNFSFNALVLHVPVVAGRKAFVFVRWGWRL